MKPHHFFLKVNQVSLCMSVSHASSVSKTTLSTVNKTCQFLAGNFYMDEELVRVLGVCSGVVTRTKTSGTGSIRTLKNVPYSLFLVWSEPNMQLFLWQAVSISIVSTVSKKQ